MDEFLTLRQTLLNQLKAQLQSVRHTMKQRADKHRREIKFEASDWVHLRLQPYRQTSVAHRKSHKLARKFYGPFQILKRIGPVPCLLDLPPTAKIHPVFHVSMLKACKGDPTIQTYPLPPKLHAAHPILEPECILGRITLAGKHGPIDQILVKWTTQTEEEATWEDPQSITERFPQVDREDKVLLQGRGDDTSNTGPTNENTGNTNPGSSSPASRPKRNTHKPRWMEDYQN